MTLRPTDPLTENLQELKTQTLDAQREEPKVEKRVIRDSTGERELLDALGTRIAPLGTRHVASFAVHVYRHSLKPDEAQILTQHTDLTGVPEALAQAATRELFVHAARAYGHKPPRRLNASTEETL